MIALFALKAWIHLSYLDDPMKINLSDFNTCPKCYSTVTIIDDTGYPVTEVEADGMITWHCPKEECGAEGNYDIEYKLNVDMIVED